MTRLFLSTSSLTGQDPTRFENEIAAFEFADRTTPPPENSILFVGSSSIRMWDTLTSAFPNHVVINRGFGGSTMPDLLYYFDRLLLPYEPALVVVYEGDNDLAGGRTLEEIETDYLTFIQRFKSRLPRSDFAFLSVKPSPSRRALLPEMTALNQRLHELAETHGGHYFDIFTPMVDDTGQPYPQLFKSDMLHLNKAGYRLWRLTLTPLLDQWKEEHAALQSFSSYGVKDGVLRLEWEPEYRLEVSNTVSGPWETVFLEEPGYHQEKTTHLKRFFRLR